MHVNDPNLVVVSLRVEFSIILDRQKAIALTARGAKMLTAPLIIGAAVYTDPISRFVAGWFGA